MAPINLHGWIGLSCSVSWSCWDCYWSCNSADWFGWCLRFCSPGLYQDSPLCCRLFTWNTSRGAFHFVENCCVSWELGSYAELQDGSVSKWICGSPAGNSLCCKTNITVPRILQNLITFTKNSSWNTAAPEECSAEGAAAIEGYGGKRGSKCSERNKKTPGCRH